jgi:hypothetical protein
MTFLKKHGTEIAFIVALVVAFAAGRYSNRLEEKTSVEVDRKTETKTDRTTVIKKDKDGKETTRIVERIREKDRETTKSETTKSVQSAPRLNVSALAGIALADGTRTYGVAVSKEIAGPVTVGAFGLTNGTIGVSVGINF